MKKLSLVLSVASAFLLTLSVAHAQGFVPLVEIPGLITKGMTADQEGLANFLNNLYKYLIGLAAVIAVVEIIWGGLLYSTQDVPGSKTDGKEKIQNALLGLVLVLSPVLVFSIINPSILNLSINLPKLDTRSAAPAQPTSCPAGLVGTPPDCKRPCGYGIRTDCNTVAPTGLSSTAGPRPGFWCYERSNVPGSPYVCVSTQTECDYLFAAQQRYGGAVRSCTLTPP